MNKKEFREHLRRVKELSDEIDEHLKILLYVVELDGRFIERLPMHQTIDGDYISKWEKRSITCLWGDSRNFNMNITRHCNEMDRR